MTLTRLDFESGANGDVITAANTGFTGVALTGGTGIISTDHPVNGTRSILFTATATSGTDYGFVTLASSTTTLAVDGYFYVTAAPSANQPIISILNGSTRQISIEMTAARLLLLRDGNGSGTVIWTSASAVPLNTQIRISLFATQSSTTGTARAAFFSGSSTTATADSGLLSSQNTGTLAYSAYRIGAKASTGVGTMVTYLDLPGVDPAAAGLNAPFGSTPPTVGTVTASYNYAFVSAPDWTFPGGSGGTFSATPSSGTIPGSTGVIVPRVTGVDTTYTIIGTDNVSGSTASTTVLVSKAGDGTSDGAQIRIWNGTALV